MSTPMRLSLIVAMTPSGVIGKNGVLPWGKGLPSDMAHFKQVTLDAGTVLMGRKTYESILAHSGKPLTQRRHVVLSREAVSRPSSDSVRFVSSLAEACAEVSRGSGRACVIGGADIYKLFLSAFQLTKLHITLVYGSGLVGDTRFPFSLSEIEKEWRCVEATDIGKHHPSDIYETSVRLYERL